MGQQRSVPVTGHRHAAPSRVSTGAHGRAAGRSPVTWALYAGSHRRHDRGEACRPAGRRAAGPRFPDSPVEHVSGRMQGPARNPVPHARCRWRSWDHVQPMGARGRGGDAWTFLAFSRTFESGGARPSAPGIRPGGRWICRRHVHLAVRDRRGGRSQGGSGGRMIGSFWSCRRRGISRLYNGGSAGVMIGMENSQSGGIWF